MKPDLGLVAGYRTLGILPPVLVGLAIVAVFFGGFGAWAALAPLERAALASGVVVVDSNRKTVQHLEGGIVSAILVQEGSDVVAGDQIIILDDTLARANMQLLQGQLRSSLATAARFVAERDNAAKIVWPEELLALRQTAALGETFEGQSRIFAARREALESQSKILRQRIGQQREQIAASQQEIKAQDRQLALIADEAAGVEELLNKGLERRPRLLALQRQQADIEGNRAANLGKIAQAQQGIGEAELRIVDLRTQMVNEAAQKLRDEQEKTQDLRQKIAAAEDVLSRTIIRAPATGKVVNLKVYTTGGTVTPREPLMEIVPKNDALIVEAQVAPTDIDVVHDGLSVQIRFPGLNQRTTPTFTGTVLKVSADRLQEPRNGAAYYNARIAIDDKQPALREVQLTPGMPAEVMIVAGSRTTLEYLVKPLFASAARALRED